MEMHLVAIRAVMSLAIRAELAVIPEELRVEHPEDIQGRLAVIPEELRVEHPEDIRGRLAVTPEERQVEHPEDIRGRLAGFREGLPAERLGVTQVLLAVIPVERERGLLVVIQQVIRIMAQALAIIPVADSTKTTHP